MGVYVSVVIAMNVDNCSYINDNWSDSIIMIIISSFLQVHVQGIDD